MKLKLADWMSRNGHDDEAVAKMVETDRSTVSRLRRGKQWPSRALASKFAEVTDGQVTADSFLGLLEDHPEAADDETTAEEQDADAPRPRRASGGLR